MGRLGLIRLICYLIGRARDSRYEKPSEAGKHSAKGNIRRTAEEKAGRAVRGLCIALGVSAGLGAAVLHLIHHPGPLSASPDPQEERVFIAMMGAAGGWFAGFLIGEWAGDRLTGILKKRKNEK